jgi:RNA polymerase sigma-70 factor (ECF subfamily)
MARVILQSEQDALDAVQDAMLKLVEKYAGKPEAEWKPLFYRILHNRLMDWQRHRHRWWQIVPSLARPMLPTDTEEAAVTEGLAHRNEEPDARLDTARQGAALRAAIRALPPRQQQAFLLRCWEGMSTQETARCMRCSEGSVKTHYARALDALRDRLGEFKHDTV